ncbi:uncharacterized protein LOC117178708 isoform X2 [Belonocnema kinseyi]|uniref:uncharacterized protein LOC117178708 isoform X2 n=1 Tax=Belonocnema kinseyi TaxID=2817044 RepID=UPI00143D2D65|nr:uncharacterized protein LOC117178708 isoform X2 [Belonocnema kinseyi]
MTANIAETALAKKLDNLTLKEWLREVGPVRRKEILKKLKVELEGLGLPKLRRGLRHGLIHLFSECSVIVERLPSNSTLGCNTNSEESCQNEKATCNKNDRKKVSDEIVDVLSVEGKAGFSNSHQLFSNDEFLNDRVSINSDPENLSTNHLKTPFSQNSTQLSRENLDANDDSFKTPYLPSTKYNSQSQKTKPCPLSRKKPLESNVPSSAMSKSTTKEFPFSEDASTCNNSLLVAASENRVSSLEKTQIVAFESMVGNREFLNCETPNSPKRRYSDTFLTISNRKKISRDERSCSTEMRVNESKTASSLPVKINLGVIKSLSRSCDSQQNSKFIHQHEDNTETESETESRLMPGGLDPSVETQESVNTVLKERITFSQKENESSRRKSGKLEDVECVKKKKKKPVKRKKSLKLVFRELFGDEEESGVQKSLNAETKRRKVDSRDSCDSGAYCSEASPISVTAYSKDADPSEMFSPDSTEKVKESLESPLQSEICPSESKDAEKSEKIPQLGNDNEGEKEGANDERVLPDSSTSISDDEVTLVECRSKSPPEKTTLPDVPSKELESPSKDSSAPGPSDDTLSKAGIVRDIEKDSYVFSSDDINILLNILSEAPKNAAEKRPEEGQTDKKVSKDLVVSESTNEDSDDVEIVLEKGPSTIKKAQISDLVKRLSTDNQIEKPSEEPRKVSFPRLRVKAPSELGCSAPLSPVQSTLPNSLPVWTQPLELPASTSSSPNPTAVLSPHHYSNFPLVNRCNDQFSATTNQVVNVALAAAQRLISLIDPLTIPDAPQLSHYYNMLISLLGEISNDTVFLRNSYVNRTYGLLSPDLFAYNLSLNRKLRNLSKFLHVAFEENTMQFILDNYHVLTTRPILNKDELYYVMSLQYSDLDANQEHPANQGSNIAARISTDPQRKTNTKTKSQKHKGGLTNEQFIILKTQIKAYNTLAKKFKKLLPSSHVAEQSADLSRVQQFESSHLEQQEARIESPRIAHSILNQQQSRVASPGNVQPSVNTVVFRRRSSQGGSQVAERIEDRSGLVITPVTTAAPAVFNQSLASKPISAKPVARNNGLTPFPRGLSITAILSTASPVPSTVSVSAAKNSSPSLTQTGCTITPISIAPRVSTISPAIVASTPSMIAASTPSMIVTSTPPMIVASTPSTIVSLATPSVIVSSPIVSSPILSSAVAAPLSSVPIHRYPLITLNETPVPKQTKLFMRLNSPLPATNSAAPVSVAAAPVSAAIVSAPISLPIVAVTILSAPIVSPAPSVPLQGHPVISNQTRVIASNPAYNFGNKFSVTNISPIPTPTITTSLQTIPAAKTTSSSTVNPRTYPAPKSKAPSSTLANLLKQTSLIAPPENVKELATTAKDSTTVENEFRSMPSLSPDPSPNSKNTDPVDGSSKSCSSKANEDDEEDLLCFRCQKKSTVVCARCQIAIYCSKVCQEKHWEEIHHETCQDSLSSSVDSRKSTETKDN